jgi:TonB family protein
VDILPDGDRYYDPPIITRIDLPVTGAPICRVAMNGRCLLELQHVYFPPEGETGADGQVTLTGTIRREGAVSGVAVLDAKGDPPSRSAFLTDFAVKYLRTWRFEPGRQKYAVRITFEFTIAPLPLGQSVEFHLPGEVRIQTNRVH